MILFPPTLVFVLIVTALGLTAVGAVSLLVLLLRDRKSKNIW